MGEGKNNGERDKETEVGGKEVEREKGAEGEREEQKVIEKEVVEEEKREEKKVIELVEEEKREEEGVTDKGEGGGGSNPSFTNVDKDIKFLNGNKIVPEEQKATKSREENIAQLCKEVTALKG